jgi:hypothetical protein
MTGREKDSAERAYKLANKNAYLERDLEAAIKQRDVLAAENAAMKKLLPAKQSLSTLGEKEKPCRRPK